jgi:hypothetical protein
VTQATRPNAGYGVRGGERAREPTKDPSKQQCVPSHDVPYLNDTKAAATRGPDT